MWSGIVSVIFTYLQTKRLRDCIIVMELQLHYSSWMSMETDYQTGYIIQRVTIRTLWCKLIRVMDLGLHPCGPLCMNLPQEQVGELFRRLRRGTLMLSQLI